MFVMVYLVNNINTEWRITFQHFNLAMVAMLVDLIMQYWIGTSKDEENDKKPFILILAIELLLAIVGLLVGYQIGIYIVIVGYICGFLLPLLMYDKFQAGQVNFPHLVERVSLIVIIAFGEAIVNLASYFNSETPITYAVFIVCFALLDVCSYVNFSEKIINHHQVSKGFVLMYSHIALVVAILMTTVATLYLNSKAIKLTL